MCLLRLLIHKTHLMVYLWQSQGQYETSCTPDKITCFCIGRLRDCMTIVPRENYEDKKTNCICQSFMAMWVSEDPTDKCLYISPLRGCSIPQLIDLVLQSASTVLFPAAEGSCGGKPIVLYLLGTLQAGEQSIWSVKKQTKNPPQCNSAVCVEKSSNESGCQLTSYITCTDPILPTWRPEHVERILVVPPPLCALCWLNLHLRGLVYQLFLSLVKSSACCQIVVQLYTHVIGLSVLFPSQFLHLTSCWSLLPRPDTCLCSWISSWLPQMSIGLS